ncbi:uncharacterized protein B0P05DRAFT_554991 [Gilbertella persicaria]|uniref:uncharacterized protein n=1 Tax=Gilbertella persicaria TaxID=101096 RepID=UPI00221F2457|nr:uncharacterized protein B0P05DRAFT_554991 [Gilbertella persicaria]KAI8064327.1 hypothetical protein B0P05DRAFT_554991 [Gilbertella persicaria]
MPIATRPSPLITPAKLAPNIELATVISYEKRQDQKIWYTIKVESKETKAYLIGRRYEDFAHFSQKLHDHFSKVRAGSRLPPKIKNRLNILPTSKQQHAQRADELNQFLSMLFQKQLTSITGSYLVLEFFGIQKSDLVAYERKFEEICKQMTNEHVPPTPQPSQSQRPFDSKWKRLRCTSFLAKSPPSTTNLSSLCSQAANKIMPSWHRNHSTPQPSFSTPVVLDVSSKSMPNGYRPARAPLKKSKSSLCIITESQEQLPPLPVHPLSEKSPVSSIASSHVSVSTHATTVDSPKSTIKVKVIYDVDNIVVIQVPRSITLSDLRSRIQQKFSDPTMEGCVHLNAVDLLYSDSSSSCCSIASNKTTDMNVPVILIRKEQDLAQIMQTKWNRLEKVTLRCIM